MRYQKISRLTASATPRSRIHLVSALNRFERLTSPDTAMGKRMMKNHNELNVSLRNQFGTARSTPSHLSVPGIIHTGLSHPGGGGAVSTRSICERSTVNTVA